MNPELGTMEDFEALVATAREHGLEIALDLAYQTSPDHPWTRSGSEAAAAVPARAVVGGLRAALGQFLGSSAGLSSSTVTKLTETWTAEAAAFMTRDLSGADYVYLWVDGIHLGIRLGEGKLCLLVMIGVRADGRKQLVALADGYRESAESWADLLRDCARRGMRAPVLAIGDGALGFWSAVREAVPAGQDPALLVPQDRERARCATEVRAPRREEGPGGDSGTPRTRTTPAPP